MIGFWYRIIDWFGEMNERAKLVRDFNKSAKGAFITGVAPTLLQARITRGTSEYKHSFSKFMASGIRIRVLSGRVLDRGELLEIGKVIIDNEEFVRKLVALGWDTLEVHGINDYHGLKWSLAAHANIGGYLKE
ncbi:MAG: hypothetical protein H8D23_04945 [Candidatus Brocadiales bacterium]|nr:hypothetical protein [Candidatus Brocadiales bacterium]